MAVRNPPKGYTAISPWIVTHDTKRLMTFLKDAFGAEEIGVMEGPDGRVGHAEMRIGDAVVLMFDAAPDWPATPTLLRLYTADADRAFKRAVSAGAEPVTLVTELAFGDRVGRVRDPFGNIWWLQTHIEDVAEDEMTQRMSDPKWTAAMSYVEDSLRQALSR